jgi:hypothetical protein
VLTQALVSAVVKNVIRTPTERARADRKNAKLREKATKDPAFREEESRRGKIYYARMKERMRLDPEYAAKQKLRLEGKKARRRERYRTIPKYGHENRARHKKWYYDNPEKAAESLRKSAAKRRDKIKEYQAAWYRENRQRYLEKFKLWAVNNRERSREIKKTWVKRNPEKVRSGQNRRGAIRRKTDPRYKLGMSLRARFIKVLKSRRIFHRRCSFRGLDLDKTLAHLESLFVPGMTWANHGSAWHIDHIHPCSEFDFTDPEQVRTCFHWSNLQPLWAKDNLAKSNRLDWVKPLYVPKAA